MCRRCPPEGAKAILTIPSAQTSWTKNFDVVVLGSFLALSQNTRPECCQSKGWKSTYLPAANAEKEAHHIGLLLLLKFLDILEGTHFGCSNKRQTLANASCAKNQDDN